MNIEQLRAIPWKDLATLRERVELVLREKEADRKKDAIEAAKKAAESFGFTVNELFGSSVPSPVKGGKKRQSTKSPVRHPDDHSLSWSRLGKRPAWLEKLLADGHRIEDLEVR